jgi:hypothetical protein
MQELVDLVTHHGIDHAEVAVTLAIDGTEMNVIFDSFDVPRPTAAELVRYDPQRPMGDPLVDTHGTPTGIHMDPPSSQSISGEHFNEAEARMFAHARRGARLLQDNSQRMRQGESFNQFFMNGDLTRMNASGWDTRPQTPRQTETERQNAREQATTARLEYVQAMAEQILTSEQEGFGRRGILITRVLNMEERFEHLGINGF